LPLTTACLHMIDYAAISSGTGFAS